MITTIEPNRNVIIEVHALQDAPGFIVFAVKDERTAQVPAGSLAEANDLADCFRRLTTIGLAESLFTD